jgi:YHS domain-containing protein
MWCRYKVHGEWRIFRWLCKENKCMYKKSERGQRLGRRRRKERVLQRDWLKRKANLETEGSMMKDPVCGMKVDENRGEFQTQFAGKKYFFCSDECRKEFEAEPDAYVETAAA